MPRSFYPRYQSGDRIMIKAAIVFLLLGLAFAALGFGGLAGAFIGIAKILFFIAIGVFVVLLVLGLMAGRAVADRL
jgi:uncharacterized membrane protein YtjA (UPF0391 family)